MAAAPVLGLEARAYLHFRARGYVDRVFEGLFGLKPQEHRDLQAQGGGALKGLSYCLLGPFSSGIMDI